jgi:predicted phage-related endonuclease
MGLDIREDSDAMELGNIIEDAAAQLYRKKTGYETANFGTMRHPQHPWMLATPDLFVFGHRRLAQIKLVGAWMAHHWAEGVPDYVLVQVQHEMEVCDAEFCDVVAIIGGTEFRITEVERDREMGRDLVEVCRSFWERHIVTGEMPPPDGSDIASAAIKAKYQFKRQELLAATPEIERDAKAWLAADESIRRAEKVQATAEQRIKKFIGDAAGVEGESFKATWKPTKTGTRVFRMKGLGVSEGRAA